MILAGVDLAWQSDKNPSAIVYGRLENRALVVTSIEPALYGIDYVENDQPQLARMWEKRQRGYRVMGYKVKSSELIVNTEA